MSNDKQLLETELLVVRWRRGQRSAFEDLVKLWERSLFYYLCRLATNEADALECLQETWLKVFRSMNSLRDPRAFPAFLYRIARNTIITRLRQPEFLQLGPDSLEIYEDRSSDPIAEFHDAQQVHAALEKLPILQREALTLFFLQELSIEEMATLLGVPIGTVKSRLFYAKKAIREILLQGDDHAGSIYRVSTPTAERAGHVADPPRVLPETA